jgi:hypothetical protein
MKLNEEVDAAPSASSPPGCCVTAGHGLKIAIAAVIVADWWD